MSKLVILLAATLGGALGWWIGAFAGTMTAFILSIMGTAIGVFVARRWLEAHLG